MVLARTRSKLGRRHRLDEMVVIAILGVICCTDNWVDVALFAKADGND